MSRTPSAMGRIKRLIVSMTISTGIRGTGVPSGSRCPRAAVGWLRRPMSTVASQRGTAMPIFIESCVVGVNVYGRSPSVLRKIINIIKDTRSMAHLCPAGFSGVIS